MIKSFKKNHFFILNIFLFTFLLSCTSTKNNSTTRTISNNAQKNTSKEINALLDIGIDFFAEGNSPTNWKLEMNFDDTVRFSAEDGLYLKFAFNQLKKESNNSSIQYNTNLKGSSIKITIKNTACATNNSNVTVKKEVVFSFNTIIYSGCGNFLANENLQGKWQLEKMAGKTITPDDYTRKPTLILNLNDESVTGNDGCNNINGQLEVQGKRIKFSKLTSTKMACQNNFIANIFSKNINDQLVDYYFKEGKLYLYLPDDSLMVFIKN